MKVALLSTTLVMVAGCTSIQSVGTRATVLAVDDQQRAMVAASDVEGLDKLAHRNLRINAPGGRVLTRQQFLANMRSGEIAAESFGHKRCPRTPRDLSLDNYVTPSEGL